MRPSSAAAHDMQTRSARESVQTAQERERRERLVRVSERLAGRAPATPDSAAGTREFLVRTAGEGGVELSQLRLQPLVRPPEGTEGAEAGITALGDPDSLSRFLAAVEGTGWPLRVERANSRGPGRPRHAHRFGSRPVAGPGGCVHRGRRGPSG